MSKEKNIKINTPILPQDMYFRVLNYCIGNRMLKCPYVFNDFKGVQYIRQSGGYHYFIGYAGKEEHIIFNAIIAIKEL